MAWALTRNLGSVGSPLRASSPGGLLWGWALPKALQGTTWDPDGQLDFFLPTNDSHIGLPTWECHVHFYATVNLISCWRH